MTKATRRLFFNIVFAATVILILPQLPVIAGASISSQILKERDRLRKDVDDLADQIIKYYQDKKEGVTSKALPNFSDLEIEI